MAAGCPSPDLLARWARGEAPAALGPGLEGHLAGCPLCRALAHGLAGHALAGRPDRPPGPPASTASGSSAPRSEPAKPPSRWWVPVVTHAVLALLVGVAAWAIWGT